MPVLAVAITDRKKMNALDLADIWAKSKAVLVNFVWVTRLESTRSSKGKLSYCVELLICLAFAVPRRLRLLNLLFLV